MVETKCYQGSRDLKNHEKTKESGATLVFALAFTLLFAGMLMILSQSKNTQNQIARSGSTGWQVTEIAKAARVYIRNNTYGGGSLGNDGVGDTTYDAASLFTSGPQEIYLEDLVNAGYLPNSFLQAGNRVENVGAGSVALTIYGQRIRVFAANAPLGLNPSTPGNFVVPAVYMVLESSPTVTPSILRSVAASITNYGINFATPLFDSGGTNISDDCNGFPAVAIWDSGCINQAEYDTTFGGVLGPFAQGDIVIPAWRVVPINTQIVSRFPQPGNANYATMLTDLHLGTCETTPLQVVQDTSGGSGVLERTDSEICDSEPDNTALGVDNRVDILGLNSLQAQRVIASDQNVDREIPDATRPTTDEHVAYVVEGGSGSIANDYNDLTLEPDAEARAQTGVTNFLDDGIAFNTQFDETLLLANLIQSPTTSATIPGNVRIFSLRRPDGLPTPADDLTNLDVNYTLPLSTETVTINGLLRVTDDRDNLDTSDVTLNILRTGELYVDNLIDNPDGAIIRIVEPVSIANINIINDFNIAGDYSAEQLVADTITAKNLAISFGAGGPGLTALTLTLDGLDASSSALTYSGGNVAIVPQMEMPATSFGNVLPRIATPVNSSDATASPGTWPITIIRDSLDIRARLVMDRCERDCPEY